MGRIISAAAWRVGISGLVALQVACTATIERRKSPDIDARIIGSDSRSLTVEGKNGRSVRVPGTDVVDIDHPGNVLIVLGAVFGALALAAADSSNPGPKAVCTFIAASTICPVMSLASISWFPRSK